MRKSLAVMLGSAAVVLAASNPAAAQPIVGPGQIINVTSTIVGSGSSFPLSQINDGITSES